MLDLLKMCYACLDTGNKELTDLSKMDFDNITLLYKMKACVSIELEDNVSKHICSTCIKQLQISYRFREMVLLSQNTWHKHKNEIMSGTYTSDFKIREVVGNPFEVECLVVKQEVVKQELMKTIKSRPRLRNNSKKMVKKEVHSSNMVENLSNSDYLIVNTDISTINISDNTNNDVAFNDVLEEYCNTKCTDSIDVWNNQQDIYSATEIKEELQSKDDKKYKRRKVKLQKQTQGPKMETKYECYDCGLEFNKRWKLQKHITRIHSNNKKYLCTYCNKGFKQSYHLREHVTSHTGERNYTCSYCDKTFQRISSMRRHIRSHEAAPGQKTKRTPFLCTVCGKSFPFSNGVQRHMRIHLGIKNHECNVCHRRFTQSTHLHVHMRTHTGEKPYICHTCGEAFSLNAGLQKHMANHILLNAAKQYVCNTCGKSFALNVSLKKHMMVHQK